MRQCSRDVQVSELGCSAAALGRGRGACLLIVAAVIAGSVGIGSALAEEHSGQDLRRDASAGDPWAQVGLATTLLTDPVMPERVAEAMSWLDKASKQRNWVADFLIGDVNMRGLAGTKDYAAARLSFMKSISERSDQPTEKPNLWETMATALINKGVPEASLAQIYAEGDDVPVDFPAARAWLEKSAAFALPVAESELGRMWLEGRGGPRDPREARKWFSAAAEQGDADAEVNLGIMLQNGDGGAKAQKDAVGWFRKAAEQGNWAGQLHMGLVNYFGQGVKLDYKTALEWFKMAAEHDTGAAQAMLGAMYHEGTGVKRDDAIAREWWNLSAGNGMLPSMYYLGVMYYEGMGGAVDKDLGRRWLQRAADGGYSDAQQYLRSHK